MGSSLVRNARVLLVLTLVATALASVASPADASDTRWLPATAANFTVGRAGNAIRYIVIHDTELSYDLTLRSFQRPASRTSAHYVIRGSDGQITQMVAESNTAWQAGNWSMNQRSIGIEHEFDRVTNPRFTEAQYRASAQLACAISGRYGIPLDRQHVIGHVEVPGATHTDPGPTWDWPHYMWLLSLCAPAAASSALGGYHAAFISEGASPTLDVGQNGQLTVTLRNTGTATWQLGSAREARLGVVADDQTFSRLGMAVGWALANRPAAQTESMVAPGGLATFTFTVRGVTPGSFRLRLRSVIDGVTWMEDQGIYLNVTVR